MLSNYIVLILELSFVLQLLYFKIKSHYFYHDEDLYQFGFKVTHLLISGMIFVFIVWLILNVF